MDIDETLARLRALTEQINRSGGRHATVEERQFTALFTALDEWLSHGGFAPLPWQADATVREGSTNGSHRDPA